MRISDRAGVVADEPTEIDGIEGGGGSSDDARRIAPGDYSSALAYPDEPANPITIIIINRCDRHVACVTVSYRAPVGCNQRADVRVFPHDVRDRCVDQANVADAGGGIGGRTELSN